VSGRDLLWFLRRAAAGGSVSGSTGSVAGDSRSAGADDAGVAVNTGTGGSGAGFVFPGVRAVVFGLGGVGSWLVFLAGGYRLFGGFVLVDGDVWEPVNSNRLWLYPFGGLLGRCVAGGRCFKAGLAGGWLVRRAGYTGGRVRVVPRYVRGVDDVRAVLSRYCTGTGGDGAGYRYPCVVFDCVDSPRVSADVRYAGVGAGLPVVSLHFDGGSVTGEVFLPGSGAGVFSVGGARGGYVAGSVAGSSVLAAWLGVVLAYRVLTGAVGGYVLVGGDTGSGLRVFGL